MAEILLSLTIIGVVAAITLPSLTGNINERTWNTQRKALYARFSQAIALMPSLNGYGTLTEETSSGANDAEDTAAETFLTDGLAKVLKINNICDFEHLQDCGIPTTITTLNGSTLTEFTTNYNTLIDFNNMFNDSFVDSNSTYYSYSQLNTKSAAFETANGESILTYYNPNCQIDMQENDWYFIQPKMCVNFVYDLNGNKGPNTVGKDIGFITAMYSSDPVLVAPMPLTNNVSDSNTQTEGIKLCKTQDEESRLPNRDELAAMFYNKTLLGLADGSFWSSTVMTAGETGKAWYQSFYVGRRNPVVKTDRHSIRCVKR